MFFPLAASLPGTTFNWFVPPLMAIDASINALQQNNDKPGLAATNDAKSLATLADRRLPFLMTQTFSLT